jgi:hypothetical protein
MAKELNIQVIRQAKAGNMQSLISREERLCMRQKNNSSRTFAMYD